MKAAATVTVAFLVVLGASMGSVAGAEQEDLDLAEQERAFWKEQLAGWGGIILHCWHAEKSEPGKRIITIAQGRSGPLAKVPDGLVLQVEVQIAGSDYIAAAISFEAGDYYREAIEQSDPDGPASLPKSGTLVLWDHMMVASGPNQSAFFSAVRDATETNLKQFFSIFVKHWTRPEDLP